MAKARAGPRRPKCERTPTVKRLTFLRTLAGAALTAPVVPALASLDIPTPSPRYPDIRAILLANMAREFCADFDKQLTEAFEMSETM